MGFRNKSKVVDAKLDELVVTEPPVDLPWDSDWDSVWAWLTPWLWELGWAGVVDAPWVSRAGVVL